MSLEEDRQRYLAAAHAVQTAIAFTMGRDTEPKHLRVGIDITKSDQGALATLLIEKGVITEAEYFKALADGMEREKEMREAEMGVKLK
jgi:hypothetical protein